MIRYGIGGLLIVAAMSTTAYAADLVVEPPVYEPVATTYDWSGGYVGAFLGYGWGGATYNVVPEPESETFAVFPFPEDTDLDLTGWLLGVDAGWNYQTGSFVLGVEGDLAWTNITGEDICLEEELNCSASINWLGTLRGRVGFAADNWLFYGTAGLAAGGVDASVDDGVDDLLDTSDTQFGWAAGIGLEYAVAEDVTVRAEYLHVDLGSVAVDNGDLFDDIEDADVDVQANIFKVGVNFRF